MLLDNDEKCEYIVSVFKSPEKGSEERRLDIQRKPIGYLCNIGTCAPHFEVSKNPGRRSGRRLDPLQRPLSPGEALNLRFRWKPDLWALKQTGRDLFTNPSNAGWGYFLSEDPHTKKKACRGFMPDSWFAGELARRAFRLRNRSGALQNSPFWGLPWGKQQFGPDLRLFMKRNGREECPGRFLILRQGWF